MQRTCCKLPSPHSRQPPDPRGAWQDIVTASPRFDMAALVPQLREYLTVLDSRKRMFLISWTTVLASVPDIDMLAFLPSLLGGLMDALQDDWREVRTAAGKALQVWAAVLSAARPWQAQLAAGELGIQAAHAPV